MPASRALGDARAGPTDELVALVLATPWARFVRTVTAPGVPRDAIARAVRGRAIAIAS